MKQIEVRQVNKFDGPVCVVVNDECNHADHATSEEEHSNDYENAVLDAPLQIWHEAIEVCNGCGAWKREDEYYWEQS